MGITPTFNKAAIKQNFDNFLKIVEKRMIYRMQRLGEDCVTYQKLHRGYTDQTANLKSSTGYIVFVNGIAVHTAYEQEAPKVSKSGVTYDGAQQGESLAKQIGAKYSNGIALVVTAGMDYAVKVESMGKDVLTSAEIYAKQELPKMIKELKANISKALD
jgi:hypothetical protein